MGSGHTVTVFGAYGHTGRFVVAELLARGFEPVLAGRDADRLRTLAADRPGLAVRPATVDDPASLDRALAGAAAVINCAGPFATTAGPVIGAALRAGLPYVDVAAEIEANLDTFAHFAERASAAGVALVPAMAFYGGLGDLLVTAAMDGWTAADEAHVAYGLSSWHPTPGTLAAGAVSRRRRDGRRVRFTGGRLEYRDDAAPTLAWTFPEPLGKRSVIGEFSMADVVTVPSHLAVPEVRTYMTVEAAGDLESVRRVLPVSRRRPRHLAALPYRANTTGMSCDPAPCDAPRPTPRAAPRPAGQTLAAPGARAPEAVDERGRSAQTFVVDAVVRRGGEERRAVASGRDIYAVSAPLAVEAVARILTGRTRTAGVASAGAMFDAPDFLRALSEHISLELHAG
ncbi:saccharopine dehydrogenase NADP-binding domain-containing protein [Streptomyces sp. RFCAC02]|uniref:saccharopine dehydrogenase family protein n=1 Tax=Streptomyces sp. RFCAC02 TaxID=2499143 RepID=UPI001F110153|nr:saccharopine dehydrogenase NADP-binding domain-containing protein [Streptomyces sp. RFCAC02]